MSDFLERLLNRAMERAPLLERRKPSMFEPAYFSPEGINEEPVFAESEASRAVPVSPQAMTNAPSIDRTESLADAARPPERHGSIGSESPSLNRHDVPPAIQPAARHSVTERIIERREMETKEIETVVERSETRAIETREIIREPHIEQRTIRVEQAAARPPAVSPLRSDQTIAMPKTASTVIAREIVTARAAATERPAVALATRGSSRERAPRRASAPEINAPTVTVTIGRVDIRAGEPARSAARAPKTFAPQLSLEDYLKSRGGGAP